MVVDCSDPRDPLRRGSWLPGLDSNQGFQLQRLTCYHYTTGQRKGTEGGFRLLKSQ